MPPSTITRRVGIKGTAAAAHLRIADIMIERFENITRPAMTATIITSKTGKPVNHRFSSI
jgi:mannosyltransferase OCH1-like enzyme